MELKLLYQTFNDDSLLFKADVIISGLKTILTCTQKGNAAILIRPNELTTNLGYELVSQGVNCCSKTEDNPSWTYSSDYWYWTMTLWQDGDHPFFPYVWGVGSGDGLDYDTRQLPLRCSLSQLSMSVNFE